MMGDRGSQLDKRRALCQIQDTVPQAGPSGVPAGRVRIAFLSSARWNGQRGWGHGKELGRLLSAYTALTYLEMIGLGGREGLIRSLFALPLETVSPGLTIVCRQSRFTRMALLYGLYAEVKNLFDVMRIQYDVMVTYWTVCTSLACFYTKLRGRKVVLIYVDNLPELYRPWLARIAARYVLTPIIARLVDLVVATSHRLTADMLRYNRRTYYIPNGVDLSQFRRQPASERPDGPTPDRCVVGFVGGFGHWIDFEPIFAVAQRHPSITCLLVGDGDQFAKVSQRAKVFPNIVLTGAVPFNEVAHYLDQMDICLIPFKRNRLTDAVSPIKLFEYWAMGKPIVSTRCYEIIKIGDGAVWFADTDVELEEAILTLRTDPTCRAHLIARGLERVQSFDWNVLVQQYLTLLTDQNSNRNNGCRAD